MALRYKNALSNVHNCISANSRGSVLLLSVLALMVVFTLGTGLLAVATSNYVMNQAEHDYQAAFYAAEAGLHHKIEVMRAEMDRLYLEGSYINASAFFNTFWGRIKNDEILNLGTVNDKSVSAVATVNKDTLGDDFCEYKIHSEGRVGRIRRTLEGIVRMKYVSRTSTPLSDLFSYAIFAGGKVEMSESSQIYGNAGTNTTVHKGFYLSGHPIIHGDVVIGHNGDIGQVIYIPWGSMDNFIKGESRVNDSLIEFPVIEPMGNISFPDVKGKPSLEVQGVDVMNHNGGGQFSKVVTTASGKLNLNLGDGDRLYTDEFKVNGAGKANVYMSGDAEIYARKLILDGSGELIFHVDGDKRVYLETLDLTGASSGNIISVEGEGRLLLFIEKELKRGGSANINLNGNPSKLIVFFNGDKVDFSGGGGSPCFTGGLYAPRATVSLSGSATVKGSIVASTISMEGDASVYFEEVVDEDDPLFGEQNQRIGPESFVIISYGEK